MSEKNTEYVETHKIKNELSQMIENGKLQKILNKRYPKPKFGVRVKDFKDSIKSKQWCLKTKLSKNAINFLVEKFAKENFFEKRDLQLSNKSKELDYRVQYLVPIVCYKFESRINPNNKNKNKIYQKLFLPLVNRTKKKQTKIMTQLKNSIKTADSMLMFVNTNSDLVKGNTSVQNPTKRKLDVGKDDSAKRRKK